MAPMNSACPPPPERIDELLRRAAGALGNRFPGSRWLPMPEAAPARKSRVFPFRSEDGGGHALLRVYAQPRAAAQQTAALRHGQTLRAMSGPFSVPELYAAFDAESALLVERVPHLQLEQFLVRAAAAPARHRAALRLVGNWLRHFHALGRIEDGRFSAERYRALLEARIQRASAAGPGLLSEPLWHRAQAWWNNALDALDGVPLPIALTHGDFTSTNILVGPGRITGIDLWAEERAPVAEDLARMFVYLAMGDPFPLRARALPHPLERRRAAQELLAGYGEDMRPAQDVFHALVGFEAMARWLAIGERLAQRNSFPERWKCAGLRGLLTTLTTGA
jgi:hypothetical protein